VERRADVVVVGAGLLGLATAHALKGRADVVVLEAQTVGHEQGGSHGPSRIFRLGYADPAYVRLAQHARRVWDALDDTLLVPTPQLSFGPGADAVFDAMTAAGAPVEKRTAAEVEEQFPMFAGHGPAVFEPDSAVIAADRALAVLADGVDVREHTRVTAVRANGVDTADGAIAAGAVVVCAGPWSKVLLPQLPTRPTLEHAAYVATSELAPIFIDFREPATYGLPTPGEGTYKIALHHDGPDLNLDAPFAADPRAVRRLHDAVERWMPGQPVANIDVCPYDNTIDEAFIVERVDGMVVGAGTSGHAFKFGPLLGEQLAALVLDA
jgi:sarcosine oxidase